MSDLTERLRRGHVCSVRMDGDACPFCAAADTLEAAEAKLAAIDARLHRSSYNLGSDIRLILHPEEGQ